MIYTIDETKENSRIGYPTTYALNLMVMVGDNKRYADLYVDAETYAKFTVGDLVVIGVELSPLTKETE